MIEQRIASGIEVATTNVLRQLPRKSRIISAVRQAAIKPSFSTPLMEARTKSDWSKSSERSRDGGRVALISGSAVFTRFTMSRVEALALFSTTRSAERIRFWRTTLVCTAYPSCT